MAFVVYVLLVLRALISMHALFTDGTLQTPDRIGHVINFAVHLAAAVWVWMAWIWVP